MAQATAPTRSREEQEQVARTGLGLLRARVKLDRLVAESARAGHIPFDEINTFVEHDLFQLKEACHALFRSKENAEGPTLSAGELFDILVGTLFHQVMMVKENTYQIEVYAPRYAALRRALRGPNPPEHGEAFLKEGERLIQRARRSLRSEMNHVFELFSEAAVVFRRTLKEHRQNPLLVRMLLDNRELVEQVYGPRSFEKLLSETYDGRPATGYLVAAADLLEGGWYDRARECVQRARKLEPKNEQAAALLREINAAARAHLQ